MIVTECGGFEIRRIRFVRIRKKKCGRTVTKRAIIVQLTNT